VELMNRGADSERALVGYTVLQNRYNFLQILRRTNFQFELAACFPLAPIAEFRILNAYSSTCITYGWIRWEGYDQWLRDSGCRRS